MIPVVLPVLRQIGAHIWYLLATRLPRLFGPDIRPYQRRLGYVRTRELRDLALREKDDFLFRLYQDHVQAQKVERAAREQAGDLTAAAILTALVDLIIAQRIPNGSGVIDAIYGAPRSPKIMNQKISLLIS